MIKIHKALEIAGRLAVLDGYPRNQQAIDQIAQLLAGFVESDAAAERLVSEVLEEFDRWPGPRTLRTIYRDQVAPNRRAEGPTWEKPVLCPKCESWGWVQQGERFSACECEAGVGLDPRVLEHLNQSKKPIIGRSGAVAATNLTLITMADVERERERLRRLRESA